MGGCGEAEECPDLTQIFKEQTAGDKIGPENRSIFSLTCWSLVPLSVE